MAKAAINPKLIHGFHGDFSRAELARLRVALDLVPGDDRGRSILWGKFERNDATLLFCRNRDGDIAFICFFELRERSGRREFFVSGASALQPSSGLVAAIMPQFDRFARLTECAEIAFATPRRGLVRQTLRLSGWRVTDQGGASTAASREFLLRKRL